ncbi:MAG: cytochrome c class [Thermoleophilia bacterium]|nr:cytochrome c class [Thermoleophilia bacterium]
MPRSLCSIIVLTALFAAGCAAPGSTDLGDTSEPIDQDKGRQLFQQTCRACHSLADANAAGVFGTDLDTLQPDAERVREQIDSGGGGMPSFEGKIEDADADLIARYVAEVAGTGVPPEQQSGGRGTVKPAPSGG